MKLLFVTHKPPYPPHADGNTLIAYHILPLLAQNYKIHLFSLTQKIPSQTTRKKLSKLSDTFIICKYKKPSLSTYYFSKILQPKPWHVFRYFDPNVALKLNEQIKKERAELVYLHSPFLAGYLQTIQNTPVVLGVIDTLSSWFNQTRKKERNFFKKTHLWLEEQKTKAYEAKFYRTAKVCIVASEKDQNSLKSVNPNLNIEVIPNGVSSNFFSPNLKLQKEDILVFSGIMDYPPNTDAALYFYHEIWPNLKKNNPNLLWIILGKNPPPEIKELAKMNPDITVTGFVKDIRPYLNSATIYVSPLRIGSGIKNKILEAMSMGKAIVASPKSCTGIKIKDKENILLAKSAKEFVNLVTELLENKVMRQKLGVNARKLVVKEYSWQKCALKYAAVFEKVIRI